MKYRCKYTFEKRFAVPRHEWSLIGRHGGLHLHISGYKPLYGEEIEWSGGIEIHYRVPPEFRQNDAPDHDDCWLLHGPCWHDGSSLQASEIWIPRWIVNPHDHENMFRMLEVEADYRFGTADKEDDE